MECKVAFGNKLNNWRTDKTLDGRPFAPLAWLSDIFEPVASLNLVLPFGKTQSAQARVAFDSKPNGWILPVFDHGRAFRMVHPHYGRGGSAARKPRIRGST
jgi:hypothetical protein